MSNEREEKLNEIKPGLGDKLRQILGLQKGELDQAGIEHKALGPQITQQDFSDALTMAVKMVAIKADEGEDVNLKDVVQDVTEAFIDVPSVSLETAEEILAVEDATEADTDDPDTEPVEETTEHEHDHADVEPDDNEKALAKSVAFNEQLIEDQKALVDALAPIAAALQELGSMPGEMAALKATVAEMQTEFAQRPRGSRAKATLISEDAVKEIVDETEEKTLFGRYPVKE